MNTFLDKLPTANLPRIKHQGSEQEFGTQTVFDVKVALGSIGQKSKAQSV